MKNILIIVLVVLLSLAILGYGKLRKAEEGLEYDININKTFDVIFDSPDSGLIFQVDFSKYFVQVPQDKINLDINTSNQIVNCPLYYDVFSTGTGADVYVGQIDVLVDVVPSATSPTLKAVEIIGITQQYNASFIFGTISNIYNFVNAKIDEYFSRAWKDQGEQEPLQYIVDSLTASFKGVFLYTEYLIAPIKLIGGII